MFENSRAGPELPIKKIGRRGLPISPPFDPTDEAALAKRIASVKVLLATLNIAVILLDRTLPIGNSPIALMGSMKIAAVFLVYMLVGYLALQFRWVSLRSYRVSVPFLDVVFSCMLVLGTNGSPSPFSLWLVMSIVAASFSSDQRIVLSATALAVLLQSAMAFLPQLTPFDVPGFIARTGFLLALGLVIAYIGNYLAKKSALLSAVDSYARSAAVCYAPDEAAEILLAYIAEFLGTNALEMKLDDGTVYARGSQDPKGKTYHFEVTSGGVQFGTLRVVTRNLVSSDDERLLRTMLDRFCTTLKKISTVEELKRSAVQEARLRLSDELHDTHIQTLTAIDLRVESMLAKLSANSLQPADLQQVRSLARNSIVGLRDFIANDHLETTDDLGEIVRRVAQNWSQELTYQSDSDVALARGAWIAIEALLREGLANAKRHGKADWAKFHLQRRDGFIIAKLETNGATLDLPVKRRGYGLTRVEAAVSGAGGQMYLAAREGGGTVLSAVFGERQG